MVAAENELRLEVDDWVAGERPRRERAANALLDRGDELPGHDAADDRVLELEALAARFGASSTRIAVLAVSAGLPLELALRLRRGGDRLEVGGRRLGERYLHAVLALHALHRDLDVGLAHALEEHLARVGERASSSEDPPR